MQKDYCDRVQRACKHLIGVTNDFLEMAKGEAGQLSVARHEAAARQVMSEAAALVAPQAPARNVSVQLVETSAHIRYLGNADRVRQVLVNVLGNALSFIPPGGVVEVIASRGVKEPAGGHLPEGTGCTIRVTDTGPGIPISRQRALLMGGDLTVSSEGSGATFGLWLTESGTREASDSASASATAVDAVD